MVGGLHRVGSLPGCEVYLANELVDTREDPYRDVIKREFPEVDLDAYFHCRPTFGATMKSVMRFCQNGVPDPFTPEERWAGRQMLEFVYRDLIGRSRLSCEDEVIFKMPAETSPGRLWRKAGFRTKLEAFVSCRSLIREFWRVAHVVDMMVIWTISGKAEMLPVSKLREEKIRTFAIGPVEFYYYQAMLFSHMNEQIKSVEERVHLRPSVWFRGHNRIARYLERFKNKIAGDVTGWDRDIAAQLFKEVYDFRVRLFEETTMDLRARVEYARRKVVESLLLFPDGSLWMKMWGGPSGQLNTTTDSQLAHVFVKGIMVWKRFQCPPPEMPGSFVLYADDHVESWKDPWPFAARAVEYKRCGFTLKKDDDVESTDVSDLTFLGFRFVWKDGLYLPVMDRTRIFNAMLRPGRKLGSDVQNQRLFGFTLLSVHDAPVAKFCYGLYRDHCAEHGFEPLFYSVSSIESWVRGEEGLQFLPFSKQFRLLQECRNCLEATAIYDSKTAEFELLDLAEAIIEPVVNKAVKQVKNLVSGHVSNVVLPQTVVKQSTVSSMPRRKKSNTARRTRSAIVRANPGKALVVAEKKAVATVNKARKVFNRASLSGTKGGSNDGLSARAGSYSQMTKGTRGSMKSVCRGVDKIAVISIGDSCEMGQILYSCSLSPSSFPGTALYLESSLWNTYKWRKCRFCFVSDQADVVVGSTVQAIDPDATSDGGYPIGGLVNLTSFSALETSHDTPLRQLYSYTAGKFDPRMTALYVRPDSVEELLTSAGTFVFVANTAMTKASGSTLTINPTENLGTLYLDYEVEFAGRNLDLVSGYSGAYTLNGLTGTRTAPYTGVTQPTVMIGNLPVPDFATASVSWSQLTPFGYYFIELNFHLASGTASTTITATVGNGTQIVSPAVATNSSAGYSYTVIAQASSFGQISIASIDLGQTNTIDSASVGILGITEDCAFDWFKYNSSGPPLLSRPKGLSRHVKWDHSAQKPAQNALPPPVGEKVDSADLAQAFAKLLAK